MDPRLYQAATQGNVQVLKQLIKTDPSVLGSKTPQEKTALHIAARLGHKHFAEELLNECNKLLVMKNIDEDTPLHIAARAGHLDIVAMLINHAVLQPTDIESGEGRPLTMTNKLLDTALHEAVKNRYPQIAMKLLSAEQRAGHMLNSNWETPLHIAAREGLKDVVSEILQHPEGQEEVELPLPETGSPLLQAVLGDHCGKFL